MTGAELAAELNAHGAVGFDEDALDAMLEDAEPSTRPRTILQLAAALLDVAADSFGNHGCNDTLLAECLSDDDADTLARLYDIANLGSEEERASDPEQAHTGQQMKHHAHDFVLMRACAVALRQMG